MSVDKHDYFIVGYKMPYDLKSKSGKSLNDIIWNEEYLPMVEGWKDEKFTIQADGMSGKYIAFGIVLADADEYEGFDFVEIDFKQISSLMIDARVRAAELFSDFTFDFSEPKCIVFSHYS